jgi:hypothetical protein
MEILVYAVVRVSDATDLSPGRGLSDLSSLPEARAMGCILPLLRGSLSRCHSALLTSVGLRHNLVRRPQLWFAGVLNV